MKKIMGALLVSVILSSGLAAVGLSPVPIKPVDMQEQSLSKSEGMERISGGIPHLASGSYFYDEAIPEESITGILHIQAWIAGRSEEVLTEESAGTGYDSIFWWINVGYFETAWKPGDELIIVLKDSANGLSGRGRLILTVDSLDVLDSLIIKEPPIYHTGLEESEAVPEEYALIGNYPNPFNPNTVIVYHLAEQAKVSIEVYDMRGHLVKVLCSEMKKAGAHKAEWDATDITGQKVMTGVYLSRMKSGSYMKTKKMVLIK